MALSNRIAYTAGLAFSSGIPPSWAIVEQVSLAGAQVPTGAAASMPASPPSVAVAHGLALGWIALLLPPLMAFVTIYAALDLWQVRDARQRRAAGAALVGVGIGSAFYIFLLAWLIASGRILELLAGPLTGDALLFAAGLIGIGVSFLVIWLGLLLERLKMADLQAAQLQELNRKLRHRSEELEEFSYAVSHDLKSPLIAIDWLVEELRAGPGDDPQARDRLVDRLGRHVEQMSALVDDLLLLAKVEREGRAASGKNLQAAIDEVQEALAPLMSQCRCTIVTTDTERSEVLLPAARLRQVLQNLVANALQHGREGGRVRVSVREDESDLLRLEVADDGPGVPEAEREQIFQAFVRGSTSSSEGAGSGIGLALVRKIARAYGGRAWVEPAPEGGACFCVLLPGVLTENVTAEETVADDPQSPWLSAETPRSDGIRA